MKEENNELEEQKQSSAATSVTHLIDNEFNFDLRVLSVG